ncbi:MAG: hypothetical protein PHD95_04305 [Candidatus ainarchaeum sp.]|nr:hypothetical protein [Candidatus ainarchaeum sp.]
MNKLAEKQEKEPLSPLAKWGSAKVAVSQGHFKELESSCCRNCCYESAPIKKRK